MNEKMNYILVALLVSILALGVGYAAISNITLTISGNAQAVAKDDNFKVRFTGNDKYYDDSSSNYSGTIVDCSTCQSRKIDDLTYEFIVPSNVLTKGGTVARFQAEFENVSNGIDAMVSPSCTYTNHEYFNLMSAIAISKDKKNISVTTSSSNPVRLPYRNAGDDIVGLYQINVFLLKTPTEDQSTSITCKILAEPVEAE